MDDARGAAGAVESSQEQVENNQPVKTVTAGCPGGAWKIGAAPDLATKNGEF